MHKLDAADLEFLYLGAKNPQGFDESDIASSEVGQIGVGRVLDRLAHLKEANMILSKDGRFAITDQARGLFWDRRIPLRLRILRLLQVRSFEEGQVARYLLEPEAAYSEMESLRRDGMIRFTTVRSNERMAKMCEITQEGANALQGSPAGIDDLLSQIAEKVHRPQNSGKIESVRNTLQRISDELG